MKPVRRLPGSGAAAKDAGSKHPAHHADHAGMAADFRKRFWISLIVTLPILALSPMLQSLLGLREVIRFPGGSVRRLSGEQVRLTELAGEPVRRVLTHAPGNGAPLDGVKVETENTWFAARPSGTEDVCKIYAESFRGAEHLRRVFEEPQTIVDDALRELAGNEPAGTGIGALVAQGRV